MTAPRAIVLSLLLWAISLPALAIDDSDVTSQMQWQPPTPTNLKVLPANISNDDLVATMRSFAQSLGVRCEFCHMGQGNDLSRFDFASDEKRQKQNARLMMRMVLDLNTKYLANVPEPRPAGTAVVTCFTCHRGQRTPAIEK